MAKVGIKTTIYNQFKGVDFTADSTLTDRSRSPYAVNIISAAGGRPEKRPGYRTVCTFPDAVKAAYAYQKDGQTHIIVHAGKKLYRVEDGTGAEIFDGMGDKSSGVYFGGKLYIVGGGAKNKFLNRLTEEATGKQVIALPIEATALGNLKVQLEVK